MREWYQMLPMVQTVCQSCGAKMRTEYVRLGAVADCRECQRATIPTIPDGGRYPKTEYEITFANFRYLLENVDYRPAVAPQMAEWFGYKVADTSAGILLVNPAGEALDLLWVHLRIQADDSRQRAIYQLAMSLWR
jgi:hypothetical protein